MNSNRISCFSSTATTPMPPPSASDPTSPIKICRGMSVVPQESERRSGHRPAEDGQFGGAGVRENPDSGRNRRGPSGYDNTVIAPAAMIISPIARPSRPSVRFTAFADAYQDQRQESEKEDERQRIRPRIPQQE